MASLKQGSKKMKLMQEEDLDQVVSEKEEELPKQPPSSSLPNKFEKELHDRVWSKVEENLDQVVSKQPPSSSPLNKFEKEEGRLISLADCGRSKVKEEGRLIRTGTPFGGRLIRYNFAGRSNFSGRSFRETLDKPLDLQDLSLADRVRRVVKEGGRLFRYNFSGRSFR